MEKFFIIDFELIRFISYICRTKENNMKKLILRFYKRFKVYLARLNKSKSLQTYEEVVPHEKIAFKICLKLISHKKSDFMIAPMSQKRFIINEDLNMFIVIDYGRVEITNHVFHYDVKLTGRDFDRILYLYDTEVEKRRINTETEVKSNIKNSLENLYEAIVTKIEKQNNQ
jgi:hypothetical protein